MINQYVFNAHNEKLFTQYELKYNLELINKKVHFPLNEIYNNP